MSETMTDEIRDSIRRVKAGLKSSGVDLAAAFAKIDRLVETQVRQIEGERDAGTSTIPECEFGDIAAGTVSDELSARIKQRGAVIFRNTFDRDRVTSWNESLMEYVAKNDYFEKQKSKDGMDRYFASLESSTLHHVQ